MKLKQSIIDRLQKDRLFRAKIADALDFTEVWIDRLIIANKDNGPLTTVKSVIVIRQETGFTDSEILEEEIETSTVK